MKKANGFSLLEILVVLVVFSFLSIVVSQSLLLTLRGARKSETLSFVRENTDFALAIMERQLHNAERVYPCPNSNSQVLNFSDENGRPVSFSCLNIGENGYVASGSGRLTSEEVAVTQCSLVCNPGGAAPPTVEISLTAKARGATGSEASLVNASTNVILRTY
jgi:prepilin-type N-terminal cleavage/methylation domain-containing protein